MRVAVQFLLDRLSASMSDVFDAPRRVVGTEEADSLFQIGAAIAQDFTGNHAGFPAQVLQLILDGLVIETDHRLDEPDGKIVA